MKKIRQFLGKLIISLTMISVGIYMLIRIFYDINSPINHYYFPMKAYTYIPLCICTALIIAIAFIACGGADRRTVTEYVVLIDETDSTFAVPNTEELLSDLGLDTNMWNGVNLTLARIEDVSYTPHSSFALSKGGNRLASNEYARKREVDTFKGNITALLDSVRKDKSGKPNSSIALPLLNEITRLANSKAEYKVILIYSDLMEHRPGLSFYDKHTFSQLRTDPAKIQAQLFAENHLPDLSGIEIRIVHEPRNAYDDAVFHVVSEGFYKKILEEKGAAVSISANLTRQN